MTGFEDYASFDGLGLAELVARGETTPALLVEAALAAIDSLNPQLNAVIRRFDEAAMATAAGPLPEGPFRGVPFLVKDLTVSLAGIPTECGSRYFKGWIRDFDSEIVRRWKAAGLIIIGKTNTPELGASGSTEPVAGGATHNPWSLAHSPGGSTGGGAAAVAAGIVPMAHANDAGGSIRGPASCCGLFGLKPTRARNPQGPYFGDLAGGLVSEHALTRTVRDSAALLDETSGPAIGDPYYAPARERPYLEETKRDAGKLKIGFLTSAPEGWGSVREIHPDCLSAVNDAARLCEDLGHQVEEVVPEQISNPDIQHYYNVIWSSLMGHFIGYWERALGRKINDDEVEAMNWEDYQASFDITGATYLITLEEVQRYSRRIAHWYNDGGYDLLLTPTLRIPPSEFGTFESTKTEPRKIIDIANSFNPFTRIQNLTGQPAMSVPLFWNEDKVPIGVHFAGRFGDEATLFRLAAQLEQARPWVDRKPPILCGFE